MLPARQRGARFGHSVRPCGCFVADLSHVEARRSNVGPADQVEKRWRCIVLRRRAPTYFHGRCDHRGSAHGSADVRGHASPPHFGVSGDRHRAYRGDCCRGRVGSDVRRRRRREAVDLARPASRCDRRDGGAADQFGHARAVGRSGLTAQICRSERSVYSAARPAGGRVLGSGNVYAWNRPPASASSRTPTATGGRSAWCAKPVVSASNATRRDAEQSLGRHLQIAKLMKKAVS